MIRVCPGFCRPARGDHRAAVTPVANPEEASCRAEQRRRIRTALQRLSSDQQLVVELAFFAGHTHSELAARLRLPLGTVKTRLRVALRQLRELLEPNRPCRRHVTGSFL